MYDVDVNKIHYANISSSMLSKLCIYIQRTCSKMLGSIKWPWDSRLCDMFCSSEIDGMGKALKSLFPSSSTTTITTGGDMDTNLSRHLSSHWIDYDATLDCLVHTYLLCGSCFTPFVCLYVCVCDKRFSAHPIHLLKSDYANGRICGSNTLMMYMMC